MKEKENPPQLVEKQGKEVLKMLDFFLENYRIKREILSGTNGLGKVLQGMYGELSHALLAFGADPNLKCIVIENNSIITPVEFMLRKMLHAKSFIHLQGSKEYFWNFNEVDSMMLLLADYGAKLDEVDKDILRALQNREKLNLYFFPYKKMIKLFKERKEVVHKKKSMLVDGYVRHNCPNYIRVICTFILSYVVWGKLRNKLSL